MYKNLCRLLNWILKPFFKTNTLKKKSHLVLKNGKGVKVLPVYIFFFNCAAVCQPDNRVFLSLCGVSHIRKYKSKKKKKSLCAVSCSLRIRLVYRRFVRRRHFLSSPSKVKSVCIHNSRTVCVKCLCYKIKLYILR